MRDADVTSAAELAAAAGVAETQVGAILRGEVASPRRATLEKVATALDVEVDAFEDEVFDRYLRVGLQDSEDDVLTLAARAERRPIESLVRDAVADYVSRLRREDPIREGVRSLDARRQSLGLAASDPEPDAD